MTDGNTEWLIALLCLIAGIIIGAIAYHLFRSAGSGQRRVRRRLAETELELGRTHEGINTHFTRMAELADELQRQSAALHQQLSEGAEQLCNDTQLKRRLQRSDASESEEENEDARLNAPRDYAAPDSGTLNNGYHSLRPRPQDEKATFSRPPRY